MSDSPQKIQEYAEQLLAHVGITNAQVEMETEEDVSLVHIQIDEEQSGLLIGHHGENLMAIQKLIQASFPLAEFGKVRVNINDYLQERKDTLQALAERMADKVRQTGMPQTVLHLPSSERLQIHIALKDDPEVGTYSVGQGKQRKLVVDLKENIPHEQ